MGMKLNNRGYVLVEIILASVIAFGIAYYMLDLTIKLKNKNDDLLAETLVMTDQAIIQNKLIGYMDKYGYDFDCGNVKINGNVISYIDNNNNIDIVNKYTTIDASSFVCNIDDNNMVSIVLPLKVDQTGKNFDLRLNYALKDSNSIHYAFGTPSTSSPTDYATVVAQRHNVMAVMYPGGIKGVCLYRNFELGCFKAGTSYWSENKNLVQSFFSNITCDVESTYVSCEDDFFICGVTVDGYVHCGDNGVGEGCNVDAYGNVNCY